MVKPRRNGCLGRIRFGGPARRWAPLCVLFILGACHEAAESWGQAEISASTMALTYSEISNVSATITGPEITRPLVVPLGAREGNVWTASVAGIPAGGDRVVSVLATNPSGVGLFFGEATGVAIRPGATTPISIVLFEMSPAPDFNNHAPVIDALTASASLVAPGAMVSLGVQAHDDDQADVLAYSWSTTCGSLAGKDTAAPVWSAPQAAAVCHVGLTVADGRGASISSSLTIVVDATLRGGTSLSVAPDRSPIVKSIRVVPTPLVVGEPVILNLVAEDPDGQELTYKWTSKCNGSFVDDTQQNAGFTLSALPESGECEFQVDVTDPLGAHTVGILNQRTGSVSVDQAPFIEGATQSHDELGPGQSSLLTVTAKDPEDDALTFSWTADAGSVTQVDGGGGHSVSLRFTAPEELPQGAMHVEVTVKDTGGQSTKVTFIFNRLNHAPVISSQTIAPLPLIVGGAAQLKVVATDADQDPLTYAWTTTCEGTFDALTSANPTFTLTTLPAGYYCSFDVVVKDGRGGQTVATVLGIADQLPVVGTPTLSTAQILVGEPTSLSVTATDPDGDALSYSWSRSCDGTFDDKTAQNPTFTLSATPSNGSCSFTVTVTDVRGGQAMATVLGVVGTLPQITDMRAIPLPLLVGQPTQLSVTAADADGDPLTYLWETDCDGSFTGGTSAAPTFTLAAVPASKLCTFQVLVSDGRGGLSIGQTTGQAGPVIVNYGPIIDGQTGDTVVSPGQRIPLMVSAHDPEGESLSYAWSATEGTLGDVTTDSDTSRSVAYWTAPLVFSGQTAQVTVIVSDVSGPFSTTVTIVLTAGSP